MKKIRRRAAFTLIELMIVVSIIGLLAAILVPATIGYLEGARQEATLAGMTNVKGALSFYRKDHGKYPGDLKTLTTEENKLSRETYLGEMPKDGWDEEYKYATKNGGKDFELKSLGADRLSGGEGHDSDIICTKDERPYVENE